MKRTKMASETIESKNKAFVLEAFDSLFNSVTRWRRSDSSHRTAFSTGHT
jgi:hypothetical protein